jgi:IMP dehydrogenase
MEILNSKSIYYDDVNLIAKPNYVLTSRKDVPEEKWRIFTSPMPSICGEKFALEAYKLGLSVCLHRFGSIEDQVNIYKKVKESYGNKNLWAAIGLNDNERLKALIFAGCNKFIIDVASGYLKSVVDYAKSLYDSYEIDLMVGNVHSADGMRLYEWANKHPLLIRVGIASGSACASKNMAAVNRGQITEIDECKRFKNLPILADGGQKEPGHTIKAFGAGAPFVMLGGYFSKAEEAQNIIDGEYKFWGCASKFNQQKFGEIRRHSEGKVLEINKDEIKPLKELVDDLWGGISSGVSYSGYANLTQFIGHGVFELKA